ncbi:putative tetrahydroberberine oxidase [Lupinus albus]|uniref:Putative tetrahydroberberine oxidase n=1 Tax=Lupinus albus TaxID=3870 RepID=A0A6A4QAN4_LUPAL|nr:putative tetrahydroberberine oxidase [Lupinus albus]
MGKSSSLVHFCMIFFLIFLHISPLVTSTPPPKSIYGPFLKCLTSNTSFSNQVSNIVFDKTNASYASILQAYIRNAKFNTSTTSKPLIIVTPLNEHHVQGAVVCAKSIGVKLRIRSGGHDYEGISYVSKEPFIILDMFNMRNISIDAKNEFAVVQSGATTGELYYNIWKKSKVHGFPAGVCVTLGIGGHLTGGGYGSMIRKYGLSIDHVIDATIVDVNGRILDRKAMGEDLFWAIRGGGAASFGVILSYTIKLVPVPEIVTTFLVGKTLEQNATELVLQWQQVAPRIDDRLFMRLLLQPQSSEVEKGKSTIKADVNALFLGGADELVALLGKEFPLLGLKKENCSEVGWVDSLLSWANFEKGAKPEALLDRKTNMASFLKRKSDFVDKPISREGYEGLWKEMIKYGKIGLAFNPYGGKMDKIPCDATPFPHRAGNLFKIQYSVTWKEPGVSLDKKFLDHTRKLYKYMTPFVSNNPRRAFLNYRDIDIGINNFGNDSYQQGLVYGVKYFNKNFQRLVKIKSAVDPENFFKHEQSIPTHPSH